MNHKSSKRFRPLALPLRLTSWVVILNQCWLPFNNPLSAAVDAAPQTAQAAQVAAASPVEAPRPVNRSVPVVQPPSNAPVFSDNPTAHEIFRARVFSEPLLPLGNSPSGEENKALAQALQAFLKRASNDDVSGLLAFLQRYPQSTWRASLLLSLGQVYRKTGYFSNALAVWEEGWNLAKAAAGANAGTIGDTVIEELTELYARLGRYDRLEALFQQIQGRDVRGA